MFPADETSLHVCRKCRKRAVLQFGCVGALGTLVQVVDVGAAVIYIVAAAFTTEDSHCMQRRCKVFWGPSLIQA